MDWNELKAHVPKDCPPEFFTLMMRCCSPEAGKRPTFQEAHNELQRMLEIYSQ